MNDMPDHPVLTMLRAIRDPLADINGASAAWTGRMSRHAGGEAAPTRRFDRAGA